MDIPEYVLGVKYVSGSGYRPAYALGGRLPCLVLQVYKPRYGDGRENAEYDDYHNKFYQGEAFFASFHTPSFITLANSIHHIVIPSQAL
jgi:hypothetical protein